ncbi:Murein DD-endopeptidase MepM/ murein hydrolase activator NlpD OS=Ureibacillus acetophenoni OX=614649 GN=SAMN05877842_105181 PE=4 SV=1 [Ureibacillus acetophenoni]
MNHNLKTAELLELNPDLNENSVLQIGQQINVTVEKPLVNVQVVQEKLLNEKIDYQKVVEEDSTMYKGETVTKQQGVQGQKQSSYVITEVNGKVTEKTVTSEVILQKPIDHIVKVGTKVISSRGTGDFSWPAVGGYISSGMGSRWGSYHRGLDIAGPSNYNIKAADNGVVTAAGWDGSYGYRIIINHNNGYKTLYAHLSRIDVKVGQTVPKGSVIGIMGSTGNSTGTHLHFEIHKNGSLVNPLSYF